MKIDDFPRDSGWESGAKVCKKITVKFNMSCFKTLARSICLLLQKKKNDFFVKCTNFVLVRLSS